MTHIAQGYDVGSTAQDASMALSARAIADHFIGTIDATPVSDDPFEHIRFSQPFDPAVFTAIRQGIPADRYFVELRHSDAIRPDGTSARTNMILTPTIIGGLPQSQQQVWAPIQRGLTDRRVETAFKRKFTATLTMRFDTAPENVAVYPYLVLTRDLAGYKIGLHFDSGAKAITVQLYLPPDERSASVGTRFYRLDENNQTHHALTVPFAPNSGYAFPVTARSWHSVDEVSAEHAPRLSLLLVYYVVKSPLVRSFERFKETGQNIQGRVLPLVRKLL